jgi:outer membrane biosynthesis protein TonB
MILAALSAEAHRLQLPPGQARRSRALLGKAPTRRPTPKPTAAPAAKALPGAKPAPTPKPTPRPTAAPASAEKTAVLQALIGTTTAVTKAATVIPIGSTARLAGTLVTVTSAAATTTIAAANLDRYGTALRMRSTTGQLAFTVTTAGNSIGHVDTFATQITAGTSTSWFYRCSALPVTVRALPVAAVE